MLQSITHFLLFEHPQYFIVLPLQLPPQTLTLDCSPWYVLTVLSILPKIIGCLMGVPASCAFTAKVGMRKCSTAIQDARFLTCVPF
jgi:hypothetical protein